MVLSRLTTLQLRYYLEKEFLNIPPQDLVEA